MGDLSEQLKRLVYTRLSQLNQTDQFACAKIILDAINRVLTTHGPLPVPGLQYFIHKDYGAHLTKDDLHMALLMYPDATDRVGIWYRTLDQMAVGAEPLIEAPHNYERAYYDLLEMFKLIRADPSLAHVPDEMLQTLLIMDASIRKNSNL